MKSTNNISVFLQKEKNIAQIYPNLVVLWLKYSLKVHFKLRGCPKRAAFFMQQILGIDFSLVDL